MDFNGGTPAKAGKRKKRKMIERLPLNCIIRGEGDQLFRTHLAEVSLWE